MLSERFGANKKSIINLSNNQIYHLNEVNRKILNKDYNLISKPCVCEEDDTKYVTISKVDRYGINLDSKFA